MKKIVLILLFAFIATSSFAAKKIHNDVLDSALNELATATNLTFTSAEPANYAGVAAVTLVSTTLTAGTAGADYAIADGDVSGRKLTVAAQTGMTVPPVGGTVTHACLDDGVTLQGCTTVTPQAVTEGQTWDSPAFDFEIQDPS